MAFAAIMVLFSLALACGADAQTSIPPGTLIPVSLAGSLNAKKLHAGQHFRAEVMQDIPGTPVRRRADVIGHVISFTSDASGNPQLEISFDTILSHGHSISIKAGLRALASFNEVQEAQVPEEGASRGITPEVATTTQIGGEQVYRGGGPVAAGNTVVGRPTPWGVLAIPRAQPEMPCRADCKSNAHPQAFWLFSTDACGVYGYSDLHIKHAGRTAPTGTIVLSSDSRTLHLASGTALLLRTVE